MNDKKMEENPRKKAMKDLLMQMKQVAEQMMMEDMGNLDEDHKPKAMMAMLKLSKKGPNEEECGPEEEMHKMPNGELMADSEMPEYKEEEAETGESSEDLEKHIADLQNKLAQLKAKKLA